MQFSRKPLKYMDLECANAVISMFHPDARNPSAIGLCLDVSYNYNKKGHLAMIARDPATPYPLPAVDSICTLFPDFPGSWENCFPRFMV